jgi:hypothetical protein
MIEPEHVLICTSCGRTTHSIGFYLEVIDINKIVNQNDNRILLLIIILLSEIIYNFSRYSYNNTIIQAVYINYGESSIEK